MKSVISRALGSACPRLWIRIHAKRLLSKDTEKEARLLSWFVVPDEATIDIGANIGDYTFLLRKLSRKVYAFEPNPELSQWLDRCFGNTIVLHTCALSDQDGLAALAIPTDPEGKAILGHATLGSRFDDNPETRHVKVPIRPLDSFDFERVGFIKIDVEGHEEEALRGALKLLHRDCPSILVEAEDRHKLGAVQRLRDYLEPQGYQGFFYLGDQLHSISAFDSKKLQVPGQDPYVVNFFFVKRDEVLQRIRTHVHSAPDTLSTNQNYTQ